MTRWLGGISRLYADRRYPRGRVLGASAAAVSGAADTSENTLATVNIPGGAMGLNGILRVTTLWTVTDSANNKTLRVRLGGIGGTAFCAVVLGTGIASYRDQRQIANRGAANSQSGFVAANAVSWGAAAGANVTGAIDTSAATTLVITAQKASGGETATLESYLVELVIPD